MLQLYFTPGTCALASRIALEEAGADYSLVRVRFTAGEQRRPEYLAINPKGRVPALVTDRGVLTETPAMLAFIAQSYPGGPSRAAGRALRLRRGPGLQQLSLLDRPCGPRPPHARRALGRRRGRHRGHETRRAPLGRRRLRPDRDGDVQGAVGDGRGLYDLRSLSLHPGPVAGGRWRRSREPPQDRRS